MVMREQRAALTPVCSLGAWLCLASLGAWGIGKRCPIGKMNNGYFKARKLSCGFGELLKYSFLVEL